MKWLRNFLNRQDTKIFSGGVAFYFSTKALDLISTALSLAFVPGVVEKNPLAYHPQSGEFIWSGLMVALFVFFVVGQLLPAAFLKLSTSRWDVASLLFWVEGYRTLPVIANNFTIFLYYKMIG